MSLKISWQYLVGFISLNMIMGELHEQAHIQTGYMICGCYGFRNFSVWTVCETCKHSGYALWATAAGPLFSYLVYWLSGLWLLKHAKDVYRRFGLALLFASLPFARIFTALMGGGDEKVVLMGLLGHQFPPVALKISAVLLTLLFCLPPLLMGIRQLPGKQKWWYAAGFIIGPLLFGMLWQRFFLNRLLEQGTGAFPVIAGTPRLVLIHFLFMVFLFLSFGRSLTKKMS